MSAVGIQLSHALSALNHSSLSIKQILTSDVNVLSQNDEFLNRKVWVGAYQNPLSVELDDNVKALNSRNLQFALSALQPIFNQLTQIVAGLPLARLAIVLGTSTSGIADNQVHLKQQIQAGQSAQLAYDKQAMSALVQGVKRYLGWQGIAYSISTACSSSAKALLAGQRLLNANLADVVLVGGVDTLCPLTLNGFDSLESLSSGICQPFGQQRDGINIGEAAALFVLTRDKAKTMLYGGGDAMDAWHISAPHPQGVGAFKAMQRALASAQLEIEQIDYINLHGTATPQNDAMETKAVRQLTQNTQKNIWVSSTKHKTGHCLGAAGAIEAYICQQVLEDQQLWLPHHQYQPIDSELNDLNYVTPTSHIHKVDYILSNSFAFGGSNCCLVLGR